MEFRSKRTRNLEPKFSLENSNYPHRLQLYSRPPPNGDEISLEEFERFAVERLKCKLDNSFSKSAS